MRELYVDEVMSRPVETATPDTTLGDAATTLVRHDVGALVVVDDDEGLEGLLTATDFVVAASEGTASWDVPVAESMQMDVFTAERGEPVKDVAEAMLDRRIHHVPVVDGETVVGMLTTMDLAARLARSL